MQRKNSTIFFWLFAITTVPSVLLGQKIKLNNGSFEDVAQHSTAPYGWHNCGDPAESPPDIQPGHFKVEEPANNGKTYIGLVTRDNDTWEGMSQRLNKPMIAGECYNFSIYLAKAPAYVSLSRSTMKEENFYAAVRLKIYGGNTHCSTDRNGGKGKLLGETGPINHKEWKKYSFKFQPSAEYNYIYLEAYYKRGAFFPYNGNLLLDNCSDIVSCDFKEVIANLNVKVLDKENGRSLKGAKVQVINTKTNKAKTKESVGASRYAWAELDQGTSFKILATKEGYEAASKVISTKNLSETKTFNITLQLKKKKEEVITHVDPPPVEPDEPEAPEGVTIVTDGEDRLLRTEEIQFEADQSQLLSTSFNVLNNIAAFLKSNPKIKVEVGGHTNNIPDNDYCDKLSRSRAKSVAEYLQSRGVPKDRVTYKGYGKRNPIATNETREGRKRNQRVDIKIIAH